MAIKVAPTTAVGCCECWRESKVAGSLVLHFEKVVESQVNVKVSNGAVADAKPNHDIGRDPDFALATTLAGTESHFQSIGP